MSISGRNDKTHFVVPSQLIKEKKKTIKKQPGGGAIHTGMQ